MFASRRRSPLAGLGLVALMFAAPWGEAWAGPAADAPPSSDAGPADEIEDAGPAAGDEDGAEAAEEPAEGAEAGPARPAEEASAGAAAAERPPMIEVIPKDKRVRHDWYIGFGWGGGVGLVRGASLTPGVGLGTSGFIHAGGRIRDPIHVGARLSTLTGRGYGASSILVEALFFPLVDKGLMIAAAVGPSLLYQVSEQTQEGMATTTARQNGQAALAVALDLGYDFWVLRRFNVGVVGRADAALRPGVGILLTGTLGLTFNWY